MGMLEFIVSAALAGFVVYIVVVVVTMGVRFIQSIPQNVPTSDSPAAPGLYLPDGTRIDIQDRWQLVRERKVLDVVGGIENDDPEVIALSDIWAEEALDE